MITPMKADFFYMCLTWKTLRIGVPYAFSNFHGGYETINQRVRSNPVIPDLGLQVLD